jgi:beta-glucosidase
LGVDQRVSDLLMRMTLPEKIAQLQSVNWEHTRLGDPKTRAFSDERARVLIPLGIGHVTRPGDGHDARGAVELANAIQRFLVTQTRLGIPAILHEEALHGFVGPAATSFPQAIALAATFDPALVEQAFTIAARQMRGRGATQALSPVVDVARDARWGRIEETYGEDPYLVSRIGVAAIEGLQGRRTSDDTPIDAQHVLATAKHFAGHGTPEGGRNTAPGNWSPRVMREVFLPPFEAAAREAHVGSIMASYNEVDAVPMHVNRDLLMNVLRWEWGWKGLVVSDYFGIAELERRHHVAADLREAGRRALLAGVDLELPEAEGYAHLADDVAAGLLSPGAVDVAVGRVLRAKFLLGLFESPYVSTAADPDHLGAETAADRAAARRAAEEAIVLLKNDKGVLPLDPARIGTLALIGPNASVCRLGGYSGTPLRKVSVVDGVRARLTGTAVKVVVAEGCGLTQGGRGWTDDLVVPADPAVDARLIAEATQAARSADVAILVLGLNEQLSREGWADNHRGDRFDLDLPGRQPELARAVLAAMGDKPTVLILIGGAPVTIPELARTVPAIIDGFYLGQETGTALAGVLFGDVNPSGKLPITIPRHTGTVPMYTAHKPSARRAYLFEEPGPEWPFGHGLSYTTFAYSDLGAAPDRFQTDGHTTISVTVTNTGKVAGDEVVQLYVHDLVSSVTRPVQELKGFRRVHVKPGEAAHLEFALGPADLAFYDIDMHRTVEPGRFEVMVGGSSVGTRTVPLDVVPR